MKKIALLFIPALILFFSACDNEIDLTAEWEDIPIAYGLLDVQDSAHYIRVEKAFLDPETSALVIAQRPDSLYYDDADVRLVDVQTEQEFVLQRVDGNEEGYQRDTGLFAHEPNYLYKIQNDEIGLQSDRLYRFELYRGDGEEVVTSTTKVLDTLIMVRPRAKSKLDFDPDRGTDFRWRDNELAAFYSLSLIIHYREKSPATGDEFVDKQLEWTLAPRSYNTQTEVGGDEFYAFLANSLESDPDISRDFESITVALDAGGEALDDYIQVFLAGGGLTGSQEIPNYSNLSEGFGVFSSVTRKRLQGIGLTAETLDSLRNGPVTADLNF